MLLKHKAKLNAQDQRGWTALHEAAFGQATQVTELLITHGADPNLV